MAATKHENWHLFNCNYDVFQYWLWLVQKARVTRMLSNANFTPFRETECKMIPVPIPLYENNTSIWFCLTLLIKNTNNLHRKRKSFLQATTHRRVNTASQLGYLWQLKPLDSSRVVRAPWLITMPFISHSLITFSLRQEAPNPSHKAFRLVPCKINTCFYPL